ncbi:MAG: EamA family transporter [Oscillospiraceae bacterium]
MWFLFSMFSVLMWSGSDLFSKIGSKSNDKFSHWKMVIAVGTVMGIHAISQLIGGVEFDSTTIITYLPVSFLYILSMIFGYAGLRYIQLSISSPICNSSGAVAAILVFLFLGQTMTPIQLLGVSFVSLGVILLAIVENKTDKEDYQKETGSKYKSSFLGLLFPILYLLIDGLGSFADALVLETLDEAQANIAYELTFFLLAIAALIYLVVIKKQKIKLKNEKSKVIAAICETAGQFTYIFAIGSNAILAAPLISSYSIFSVLWSRIFLKEKLSNKHYYVIFLVFIGIVILGLESK